MSASAVPQVKVVMDDPSEYRPEYRDKKDFRNFDIHTTPERVIKVYKAMHKYQTYDFAKGKLDQWGKLDHAEMTVMEALESLNNFVDQCDPDIDVPNAIHAYQTAEGIRKKHPDNEWFQVTGLIHDIGKIMAMYGEPQWCVVGDTFPVGCAPAKSIVFDAEFFKGYSCQRALLLVVEDWKIAPNNGDHVAAVVMDLLKAFACIPYNLLVLKLRAYGLPDSAIKLVYTYLSFAQTCKRVYVKGNTYRKVDIMSNNRVIDAVVSKDLHFPKIAEENPDITNEKFNTKLGIYEENCGLDNVIMSWGHDEYLYRVLKGNTCHLPDEALYCIRFHSFYPWHTSGDYYHLCNNKDIEMLKWVNEFNQFDLYSKSPDIPELDELIPYYTKLVEKYVPGTLRW